jgi:hypothetical protein
MNQQEENFKNITETLELVDKLPEDKQAVVVNIIELLNQAAECVEKGQIDEAVSKYYAPLISMLTFEFIRHFVAEHLSKEDALSLLLKDTFKRITNK